MGRDRGRPMRVQKNIDDRGIAWTRRVANDPDYLTARLHARRSRMAEGERLDALCRIRSLSEFFKTIFPDSEFGGFLDFQRRLVHELITELSRFRTYMLGPGADLIDWTLVRFQVENLKVFIRGRLTETAIQNLDEYLVSLPGELTLNTKGLTAAKSPEDFIRLVPKGVLRENFAKTLDVYRSHPRPFFLEAALDRGYFQGLVVGTRALSQEDREVVEPMIYQEVDIFHLMLVTRGKFHYGLAPASLRPFHVAGTRISYGIFASMLSDQDFPTSVGRAAERVFDTGPSDQGSGNGSMVTDPSAAEGLAWKRFLRLADLAFRQSHMGLGAIMGYVGLRHVEIANLITISEGIRSGMAPDAIRAHLIPRIDIAESYIKGSG